MLNICKEKSINNIQTLSYIMPELRAILSDDLTNYLDSLVDGEIILNRTDALRTVVFEHRKEHKSYRKIMDGVN